MMDTAISAPREREDHCTSTKEKRERAAEEVRERVEAYMEKPTPLMEEG